MQEKDFVNQPKFIHAMEKDTMVQNTSQTPNDSELEEEEIGNGPLPNRPDDITSHMTRGGS